MYYCYQLSNNDCGYACLKMCLANIHHNKDYLTLTEDFKEENYSMFDLISIAKKYNIELKGYEVENINEIYNQKNMICLIKENEMLHYVLFVKKKKSRIIIFDSKYGLRSLSEEEFCSLFQNKVLICKNVGTDNLNVSNKKKCLSYYLFFFVINLFDFFLLTMSTYYINSSSSLILIFLIACVFIITRVNKNIFIQFYIQNFDKKYMIPILNNEKFNKESYRVINDYKVSFITHISEFITSISTLIFLCYIFLSDSLYHIFIIIFISLINLIIFIFKNKNDEKIKIAILEDELFKNKDKMNIYDKMQKIIKTYVFKENFIQVFIFVYSFILVYFKMSFSNIDSFIYLLFYTIGYVEFSKNFTLILSHKTKKMEFLKKSSLFDIVLNQIR